MDESFSATNLRRVWDRETRKGRELARLFPEVASAFDDARQARRLLHRVSGDLALSSIDKQATAKAATDSRAIADLHLERALLATSHTLIDEVETKRFSWGLHEIRIDLSRRVFGIKESANAYFAEKQLQQSIGAQLYHSRQSRQSIIQSLVRTLDNSLPKAVIKADVEHFYETIDHGLLMKLIRQSTLTRTSQSLIELLLSEYAVLTRGAVGLPTGVGVSAKLAEFYISRIDQKISNGEGQMYYARYVDDIVFVHGLTKRNPITDADLLTIVRKELGNLGLRLNLTKSNVYRSLNGTFPEFELLGYKISRSPGMKVTLTDTRVNSLKHRLTRTFDLWDRHDSTNTGYQGLLLHRLRFLTGNTRLKNNKRNAMIGIYFSNPHINDLGVLDELDEHMNNRATLSTFPPKVATQIAALSFRQGFDERLMFRFTPVELRKIRGAWRG